MIYPIGNGTKEDFLDKWYIPEGGGFGYNRGTYFHEGVDLNLKTGGDTDLGQEIKAIANGKVVYYHLFSHFLYGFGRHQVYKIDGAWGTRWVMNAHCSEEDFVASARDVNEGEIVARIGKSGTTYAHLHLSIFKVDPITLPNKIDTIAKTSEQLNDWWEDPVSFVDTWIQAPVVSPVTDQSKYDFGEGFGVMELQAAKSIMQDQKNVIDNLNSKLSQIRAIVG